VSGAVALILQKYPTATPDQVKALLMASGLNISGKSQALGGGELNLVAALAGGLPSAGSSAQSWPSSTGTGSLELSRGSDHLTLDGVILTGETDIFGQCFDAGSMADLEAAGHSWSGGTWNGSVWTGSSWSGSSWSGHSWSGSSWSGNSWSSAGWE